MKFLSYAVYIFLQCTWGIFQTIFGFVYFIISLPYPHEFYHGCIKTLRPKIGGVSLGLFIFVGENQNQDMIRKTAVHEYGHTIQSLILGPFYLLIIGIVSATWCSLPYFINMRKEKNISYNACFTESQANYFGEKFLKQDSTKNLY